MDSNMERSLLGEDFGARDPTAGEIGSNFAEKVLGNYNTEHIIKPPDAIGNIVGLKNKRCVPCEGDVKPLGESDVNKLRLQVPGWKVRTTAAGTPCIAYEWKVRSFRAGLDLLNRLGEVAEAEGHHPDLRLEGYSNVTAEITTHAAGGLTENDFILAAKINELELGDLLPKAKPKFWA